jgi:hypothetical protein
MMEDSGSSGYKPTESARAIDEEKVTTQQVTHEYSSICSDRLALILVVNILPM